MRKYLLLICGAFFFLSIGVLWEKSHFFRRIQSEAQVWEVPMGFLDYGSMGDILKRLAVIKVVEKDLSFGKTPQENEALVRLRVQTDTYVKFQIFWSGANKTYTEKNSATIFLSEDESDYYLNLPSLESIQWLRIDPADKPCKIILSAISIEQVGYAPILLSGMQELKRISPLNGILEISYYPDGLKIMTEGNDSQLEVLIGPGKRTTPRLEKIKYVNSLLFKRKRQPGEYVYAANPGGAERWPSARVIRKEYFKEGWPLISVVTQEENLYGKAKGIIRKWYNKGSDWERLAYVSYFENGLLKFSTNAGLQIHGRSTRSASNKSFRLYFRKEYGRNKIEPGLIFDTDTKPVKRLVISTDRSDPRFRNIFALDIARRVGCITPEIKPVVFYLNGKENTECAYFLIELVNKTQWAQRLGHDNFVFFTLRRKQNKIEDVNLYRQLEEQLGELKKTTMTEVDRYIDIENFSKWLITTVFVGNWDFIQGSAVLDKEDPNGKWYWVIWDMDVVFFDWGKWGLEENIWQQRGFPLTFRDSLRMNLFKRLMSEDADYHRYFVRLFMDTLNHRINDIYLKSRIDHFDKLSKAMFGEKPYFNAPFMKTFMTHRPKFLRSELRRYYGDIYPIGEDVECSVKGPEGIQFLVDGYPENAEYRGIYFKGERINVQVMGPNQNKLLYWKVNGAKIYDRHLMYMIDRETIIEPVFQGAEQGEPAIR